MLHSVIQNFVILLQHSYQLFSMPTVRGRQVEAVQLVRPQKNLKCLIMTTFKHTSKSAVFFLSSLEGPCPVWLGLWCVHWWHPNAICVTVSRCALY